MAYGLDYILGVHYKSTILKHHPQGMLLGIGAGWFRDKEGKFDPYITAQDVVQKACERSLAPKIRIPIIWDDGHSFYKSDLDIILAEAREYEQIAKNNKQIKIELAPLLEHSLANPDWYLDRVKEVAPSCTLVNSVYRGSLSTKYINEVHGLTPPPKGKFIYSYDGTHCVDTNVEFFRRRYGRAIDFYWWIAQLNQKYKASDSTPRSERVVIPSREQLESLKYLNVPRSKRAYMPDGYLWKSHGDQHSPIATGREGKPVMLIPQDADKVELISTEKTGSKVLDVMYSTGFFSGDGREIWRSNYHGYDLMEKALKIQKAKIVRVRIDGKVVGRVDAGFRQNEYKNHAG